ncbi:MAG: TonB C-terminal domain-containing protein [Anaerolineae bacterium]|nr:TonB C-terminal domain-containing protein [Gloeobacterales cyanobacterium ES-bin-313]
MQKVLRFYSILFLIFFPVSSVGAQETAMPTQDTACEASGDILGKNDGSTPDRIAPSQTVNPEQNVNFSPYMAELKRRIRQNWIAPDSDNLLPTVVNFCISRSGDVSRLRVVRSSTFRAWDQAAVDAVRQAAPFSPLPDEYIGKSIEINFTLSLNVFGYDVRFVP